MFIAAAVILASIELPPPRYDYEPPWYRMPEIIDSDSDVIFDECGGAPGVLILSCISDDNKTIWILDDLSQKVRAHVLRHEFGHANGWNHPHWE
jgi:hypothetical protein